jgi:hypothetical protein
MTIYLSRDIDCTDYVNEFFAYHEIPTTACLLWNADINQHEIPADVSGSLLIIDHQLLWQILRLPSSSQQLINFCNRDNQLWVFGSYDHAYQYIYGKCKAKIVALDQQIKKSSMLLLIETDISDRFYLGHLQNIRTISYRNWHFSGGPRPNARTTDKLSPNHDYLLTMIKKSSRPHRNILWQELTRRPGLLEKGQTSFRHHRESGWSGRTTSQHDWQCGHASMDLYQDCWLEIVPETCYRDLYFFTEKTYKPIMTRTPFLTVSTAGYLAWLRDQGFQTFHSLIDEGYDRHYRIEDRVRHMTDVLEDIVTNGAKPFYQASVDILDHNFSRISEIAGSWRWQFDQVMWQALEDFPST